MIDLKKRTIKLFDGFFSASLGLLLVNMSGLIFQPLIARYLGPESYGYFGVMMAFFTILSYTLILGIDEGCKKYLPRKDVDRYQISIVALLNAILSGTIALIIGLTGLFLTNNQFISFNITLILFLISLVLVFSSNILNISKAFLYTQHREHTAEALNVLNKVAYLSAIFLNIYLGLNLWYIPLWLLLSHFLFGLIGIMLYFKDINKSSSVLNINQLYNISKKLGGFGALIIIINLSFNIHLNIDLILVDIFLSQQDTGIYKAMIVVAHFLWLVPAASSKILLHNFTQISENSGFNKINNYAEKIFQSTTILTALLGIGIVSLAEPFIQLYFGSEYVQGAQILKILAIGAAIGFPAIMISPVFESLNKTFYSVKAAVYGMSINIILNLALIPIIGIKGAAIATSLSYSSLLIIYSYFYFKQTGYNLLKNKIWIKLFANIILVYIILELTKLILSSFLLQLLIIPLLGLIVYTAGGIVLNLFNIKELRVGWNYLIDLANR